MDETLTPAREGADAAPDDVSPDSSPPPPWFPSALRSASLRLVYALVTAALAVILIVNLVSALRNFLSIIFMAVFLSFAVEPAVNWLASHGWRRGLATGMIFLLALGMFVLLVALIVPAVISGFKQLASAAPAMLDRLQEWLAKLGIDFSTDKLLADIQKNADKIVSSAASLTGGILSFGASILGLIFRWATIALFLFYFVAEGPRVRRAVCSRLPPGRQRQVLFIWEQAITKTGGYFYSRLLLAIINGTGLYIVLRIMQVPFAAPMAMFVGIVSEFIPIVGTYIAGALPTLVALLFDPFDAVIVVAYILVYQQVENYFLSPRLTAHTMALHPAVAFGAAIIGGALGGILMAFLALPAAAVIQAAVVEYGRGYEVVESDLTREPPTKPGKPPLRTRIRKRVGSHEDGAADGEAEEG